MANKGWLQFLLVAVPVLSLIGAWLALRTLDAQQRRAGTRTAQAKGVDRGVEKE
ncbi:hypothetical protein GPA19_20030 [Azoarcus indigens]|uniref:hypothetical protein n=1 Tax=Azoarcus indigens TaxID=29545 RepID=UPI0013C34DF6|nr:hypothetical protein [Azoarcus indigens]NMG67233.1 hypothetical protein [Azoarcus indigens]